MTILNPIFFDRPADQVAHDLVGGSLNWTHGDEFHSRMITETEAYIGPHDLASHAARGRTKRTEVMFGEPGTLYLYFVYGMHWMLNVVTGPVGYPAAVLIRAVQDINGPARLTKAMVLTGSLNGKQANEQNSVWFTDQIRPPRIKVIRSARIGVDYAGPVWSLKPLRFSLRPPKVS